MKEITLNNSDETIALGAQLASKLQAGDVIVLNGDLGAGKTTFTKGIAKGLGIKEIIKVRPLQLFVNTKMDVSHFIIWMLIVSKMVGLRT